MKCVRQPWPNHRALSDYAYLRTGRSETRGVGVGRAVKKKRELHHLGRTVPVPGGQAHESLSKVPLDRSSYATTYRPTYFVAMEPRVTRSFSFGAAHRPRQNSIGAPSIHPKLAYVRRPSTTGTGTGTGTCTRESSTHDMTVELTKGEKVPAYPIGLLGVVGGTGSYLYLGQSSISRRTKVRKSLHAFSVYFLGRWPAGCCRCSHGWWEAASLLGYRSRE